METLLTPLLLAAAAGGYLLGAIPFGLVLTRLAGLGDIRAIGSGNIGATNVLRTGRKGLAAAVLLLDSGKGAAAALTALALAPAEQAATASLVAGVAAVLGHNFPVWLRFKGGKGFATAAGVLLALAWPAMLACAAIWAATLSLTRISSVSSMTTVVLSPAAHKQAYMYC